MTDASFKSQIRNGQLSVGSWISIPNTFTCEMMAKAQFDWLVVDLEHASISPTEAAQLIQVITLNGKKALVRVGANDPLQIKLALDAGADGIIVPMIESAKEAQAAISSIYYPPIGRRGTGLWRAQRYGHHFAEYRANSLKNTVFIAQIESKDGADNLPSILGLEHVDGILVGPYDLSASLGVAGQLNHPAVVQTLKEIASATRQANKALGYHLVHPTDESKNELLRMGYNLIAVGVDSIFLNDAAAKAAGLFSLRHGHET